MSKEQPSSKYDGLRAMREASFAKTAPPRAPATEVRKAVEAVPAKRPAKKAKRKGRR